ncbi:MAG TPA: GNAT family N-acetyltransferase [Xanthobacteraceae bacterium]|jgi:RimJ/RimL family protein N-acetyltransferase
MTLSEEVRAETSPPALDTKSPVLATERLILRRLRLADAESLASLANDRRVAENTARIPHPYTVADAVSFVTAVTGPESIETVFVATLPDGDILGLCGFGGSQEEGPELGYWFGAPYWGQGYTTEAVRAVVDYAFTECEHDVLLAGARVTNAASRRVLEKCGFQWTGVRLQRIRALASSVPVDQFRLKRHIWAALKSWGPMRRVV